MTSFSIEKSPVDQMICRTLEELRDELRRQLRETDQPLRAVSEATGISTTNLHNFMNGKRRPGLENLDKLAAYFKVKYNLKNY